MRYYAGNISQLTQGKENTDRYLQVAVDVLTKQERFSTALDFYTWLVTYSATPVVIAYWKVLTAECMLKMNNSKSAKSLLHQAFRLYKQVLGLGLHEDVLEYLQHKIASSGNSNVPNIDVYGKVARAYRTLGDVYSDEQQYNEGIKSLSYSLSIDCLLLHFFTASTDQQRLPSVSDTTSIHQYI